MYTHESFSFNWWPWSWVWKLCGILVVIQGRKEWPRTQNRQRYRSGSNSFVFEKQQIFLGVLLPDMWEAEREQMSWAAHFESPWMLRWRVSGLNKLQKEVAQAMESAIWKNVAGKLSEAIPQGCAQETCARADERGSRFAKGRIDKGNSLLTCAVVSSI